MTARRSSCYTIDVNHHKQQGNRARLPARLVYTVDYLPIYADAMFCYSGIPAITLSGLSMKIRFLSANQHKLAEVRTILDPVGVEVIPISYRLEEIQTENEVELVRDKLTKAFAIIGRPLFVEHTGLYLDGLNGLPAGLTRIFWNRLDAERFIALVQGLDSQCASAKTVLGYCDGRKMYQFSGEVRGKIVSQPAGSREFLWDCIFVPDGYTQTFAEMGELKNEISMRRLALDRFATFLQSARGGL